VYHHWQCTGYLAHWIVPLFLSLKQMTHALIHAVIATDCCFAVLELTTSDSSALSVEKLESLRLCDSSVRGWARVALLHSQSSHIRLIWCKGPQILLCGTCFLSFSCDFMCLNKSSLFSGRTALMIPFLPDLQAEPCQFMTAGILPYMLKVPKNIVQSLLSFDLWISYSTLTTASLPTF